MMKFSTSISDKKEIKQLVSVMVAAYREDPVIKTVFRGSSHKTMLDTLLKYYLLHENVLIGRVDGQVKALVLWSGPNSPAITIGRLLRSGMIWNVLKFVLTTNPRCLCRTITWSEEIEKNHYNEQEHNYLFMITSAQRGCGYGKEIMAEFLRDKTMPVYLENSNPKLNNRFYTNSGFKKIGEFDISGNTNEKFLYTP